MSNQRERVKVVRPDGGYTYITRQAAESRAVRNLDIRIEEDTLVEVPEFSEFSDTSTAPAPEAKRRGRPTKAQ